MNLLNMLVSYIGKSTILYMNNIYCGLMNDVYRL